MRQAIGNKTHYKNGITLLDKQFDDVFHHKRGPGALPASKLDAATKPVRGLIVPHGSYDLAGPCAAWAYKALAEEGKDSHLYIIIGQAQHSTQTGVGMETYAMPYGEVRVAQHFARDLIAKGHIAQNDAVHAKETLIEVQLPFLQYIHKSEMEKIKIVPLLVGSETNIEELSVDIKETLLEHKMDATFIFVSNMTSYGRSFQYVPFTENVAQSLAELDSNILKTIQEGNKQDFIDVLGSSLAPLSGYSALLMLFQLLAPFTATVEQHYHSGDINGNYNNTVGYASVILK